MFKVCRITTENLSLLGNKEDLYFVDIAINKQDNDLPTLSIVDDITKEDIQFFLKNSYDEFLNRAKIIDVDCLRDDNFDQIQFNDEILILHQVDDYLLIVNYTGITYQINIKNANMIINLQDYVKYLCEHNCVCMWNWDSVKFMQVDYTKLICSWYFVENCEFPDLELIIKHVQHITNDIFNKYYSGWVLYNILINMKDIKNLVFYNQFNNAIIVEQHLSLHKHQINIKYVKQKLKDNLTKIQREFFIRLLKGIAIDENIVTIKHDAKRVVSGRIICAKKQVVDLIGMPKDKIIGDAFISSNHEGEFWSVDHKYFEPRIVASLVGNYKWVNNDPYTWISKMTLYDRNESKKIYALLAYGGCDYDEFLAKYENDCCLQKVWHEFAYLRSFRDDILKESWSDGKFWYIKNPFGRIVKIDAKYKIFNQYVQSIGADVLIVQIIELLDRFKKHRCNTTISFQKYDEIILDVAVDESDRCEDIVFKALCCEDIKGVITKKHNLRIRKGYTLGTLL